MDLNNLRAIHEQKRSEALAEAKHTENQVSILQLQETVVRSFATLVDYLDSKVSKTEVVNQLREIGTPDAFEIVRAVNNLDATIKDKKEVDLSQVTTVLREVLAQVSKLPKELPEQQEQKFVDYSEQLADLKQIVENVVEAIKAQKTTVEAPVVNIPETVVNVPATDLKPLEKGLEKVTSAVKAIELPKTDVSGVETRLDKSNKLLKQIVDKPVGGGGGGGSSWTAVNEQGIAQPLQLQNDGLLTTDIPLAIRQDDLSTPNVIYVGKAPVGSATSAAVWQVHKIDEISGVVITWAGNAQFNQVYDNRVSLTYS